ncbi:DUF3077 domain-containing protein [Pseudomonas xantholysinigenes]|uniref:DUF3077 domain-containing protein n=1 Tax=Pseudomonas xantholysinigenes TaxID=2745490 RepID=A0A9E6TZW1_9PSED|nr:DUF3077 domain-containing protein [Pseudomonas xantholysinigenes]QXI40524.1 DUF3077 domain-containing protein [Pseudomonas xantholysinigenes]
MDKDDWPKGPGQLKIISLAAHAGRQPIRNWVQAIPGLPTRAVLQETAVILGVITGLTQQALVKPREAQTLMRATYYLSGMAKAMIDGQLSVLRGDKGDCE